MIIFNRIFYFQLFGTLGIFIYKHHVENKIKELNELIQILEAANTNLKTKNCLLEEKLNEKENESRRIIKDCEKELLEDKNEDANEKCDTDEYDKLD